MMSSNPYNDYRIR